MTIEFHQARCGWRAVLLAVLVVALGARGAWAHRINVFAATEGRTITGRVYFSGGGRAQDVEVRVLGPGGQSLGRTRTDAEGEFTFEAALRCDHQFVVETDDGHRASYTVGADELPEGLPVAGDPPAEPEAAPSSPQASVAPATQQAELVEMAGGRTRFPRSADTPRSPSRPSSPPTPRLSSSTRARGWARQEGT